MAPSPTSTIEEFNKAAADEITKIDASAAATSPGLASRLAAAGLNAAVLPSEHGFKVTVKVNDKAGLPAGTSRSDFNDGALARMDAKHLAAEKERVWQW